MIADAVEEGRFIAAKRDPSSVPVSAAQKRRRRSPASRRTHATLRLAPRPSACPSRCRPRDPAPAGSGVGPRGAGGRRRSSPRPLSRLLRSLRPLSPRPSSPRPAEPRPLSRLAETGGTASRRPARQLTTRLPSRPPSPEPTFTPTRRLRDHDGVHRQGRTSTASSDGCRDDDAKRASRPTMATPRPPRSGCVSRAWPPVRSARTVRTPRVSSRWSCRTVSARWSS